MTIIRISESISPLHPRFADIHEIRDASYEIQGMLTRFISSPLNVSHASDMIESWSDLVWNTPSNIHSLLENLPSRGRFPSMLIVFPAQ
jgi:hypothetical protein